MSLKIDDNNYLEYKQVYEIICRHLFKDLDHMVPADSHPIAVLNNWETKSKSLAKRGLKAGLMDSFSSINHYPKTTLVDINSISKKTQKHQ
jgi:hypothetical protein